MCVVSDCKVREKLRITTTEIKHYADCHCRNMYRATDYRETKIAHNSKLIIIFAFPLNHFFN